MANLADVTELADYIGEPITEETDVKQAEALLRHASSLVRSEAHQSHWQPDNIPDLAKDIVLACAARAYTNFEGWGNEGIDDWHGGGRPIEEWGLYLTATERRVLAGFKTSLTGLSTIDTTRQTAGGSGTWVPAEGGGLVLWY